MANSPIFNIADALLRRQQHGKSFDCMSAKLGPEIGACQLGCRVVVVPAGKCAWPFHCHHANEEMFFILEGTATYRFGPERFPIRAGDVIGAPAGGQETAHQIINDSAAPLRYLVVSTMREPDIMEYPDSNKFGAFAGSPPGGGKATRTLSVFAPFEDVVEYWHNED